MLNIFYGRECVDKEKFIFDNICGKTILMVPDQYTLEAERKAFKYLGVKGLMEIEVISPSRFGQRILKEVGGDKETSLDKYGRHMLLTKIIKEERKNLSVYKGMDGKAAFVELMNNLISEMKQYNTRVEDLEGIISSLEEHSLLRDKLGDIRCIFEKYEKAICNTYIDTEDKVQHYIEKIKDSSWVKDCTFWVYGFDYFTPKNLSLIGELIDCAIDVNVVMTYSTKGRDDEIFNITGTIIKKLQKLSEGYNKKYRTLSIGDEYSKSTAKAEEISFVEQELFSLPAKTWNKESTNIRLVRAANPYAEMESAANYISKLIKEEGFRYRDIAVICNDLDVRGNIIERIFNQYGLKIFLDKKRNILQHPVIRLNLHLLEMASGKMDRETVIGFMETGLVGMEKDFIELIENYAIKYKIKGNMWHREFVKGRGEYAPETFEAMNEARKYLSQLIKDFVVPFNKAELAGEKIGVLYHYLKDRLHISERLTVQIERFTEKGWLELAFEVAQIWKAVVEIYDQIATVMGAEKVSVRDIEDILKVGFSSVEMGMLPATIDEIVVGTMQRTRTGAIKALVIVGANEGILPSNTTGDGILNEDEKRVLYRHNAEICKVDEVRTKEEKIALYRMLAAPEKYLYISYSFSDTDGSELKPSEIFNKVSGIFPQVRVSEDVINRGDPSELIMSIDGGKPHLMEALRRYIEGEDTKEGALLDCWKAATAWYKINDAMDIEKLCKGLFYSTRKEKLGQEQIKGLYKKNAEASLTVSPSRLEKFGRCPFAHFINYGLRPEERRVFEIAGREMGDIYHLCLMRLSQHLTEYGVEITAPNSKWMSITPKECEEFVSDFLSKEASIYGEGLLLEGPQEKYKASRIKKVCTEVALIMIEHVQQGKIKNIFFETEFGRGREKTFPAIEVDTDIGKVFIEGKIDRVDILPEGYVKVIDYKSGNEKFNISEIENGWRLQLMLYLEASLGLGREKPAGVFYFKVDEPLINASEYQLEILSEKIGKEVKKMFRLDGVMIDESTVIENIAGDFVGNSDIISIKKNDDGSYQGSAKGKVLTVKEFEEFKAKVDDKVGRLCVELISGSAEVSPGKNGEETACRYCQYHSICKFDLAFEGCSYRNMGK